MLSLHFPNPRPVNTNFSSQYNYKPFSLSTNCTTVRSKISHGANGCAESICKPNSTLLKFRLAWRSSKCAAVGNDDEKSLIFMPEDLEPEPMPEHVAVALEPELMPKHVAVIMDGNRQWATRRGLPAQLGHRAGGKAVKQLAINCRKYGVKVVSLFALSTENWVRPMDEINFLMDLFEVIIASDIKELMGDRYDMRISLVGNRGQLPWSLQELISTTEERAKTNKGMHLQIAMNYGGRYDITEETKKIATKVKDGVLRVEYIDDSIFEQHLETYGVEFANPDLLIRTGGELRASNFMLWQLAYSEMFFTEKIVNKLI